MKKQRKRINEPISSTRIEAINKQKRKRRMTKWKERESERPSDKNPHLVRA